MATAPLYAVAIDFNPEAYPPYPETGQTYWIIFNEGYRSSRLEMTTFDVTDVRDETCIIWNRSLALNERSKLSRCNQYKFNDGVWEQIGTYGTISDYATKVIASNMNVYDKDGKLLVPATMYMHSGSVPQQPTETTVPAEPAIPTASFGSTAPRYTVLVLDASATVNWLQNDTPIYTAGAPIEKTKEGAKAFCRQAISHSKIAVVAYAGESFVVSDFTNDLGELHTKIDAITVPQLPDDNVWDDCAGNIVPALKEADRLLSQAGDDSVKNVVVFSSGITNPKHILKSGRYSGRADNWWFIGHVRDKNLYEGANAVYEQAKILQGKYNVYSIGIFQNYTSAPSSMNNAIALLRDTVKDIAGGEDQFYDVDDIEELQFVFGQAAQALIGNCSFTYRGGDVMGKTEGNQQTEFFYSDSLFDGSSYSYRQDLSVASLCLAMAAYGKHGGDADLTEHSYKADNVKELLETLGFENPVHNDEYIEQPAENSIGVIMGLKAINDNEALIAVAIRGGGYEREWGGNFNLGTGETHRGFEIATQNVMTWLTTYINNNKGEIGEKHLKLWITGYSRGSAVANLLAAQLDDWSKDGFIPGIEGIKLSAASIFTYCFETPAGTKSANWNNSVYKNIFCIVNPNDFVPKFAPGNIYDKKENNLWGYHRYGVTLFLPTPESTSNYKDYETAMLSCWTKLSKSTTSTYSEKDYNIGGFEYVVSGGQFVSMKKYSQSLFLDDFFNTVLAKNKLKSASNYADKYQDKFVDTFSKFGAEDMGFAAHKIWGNVFGLVVGLAFTNSNDLDTFTHNANSIFKGHYPDLCLAWMKSFNENPTLCNQWLDSLETNYTVGRKYRIIRINCPVDAQVFDGNNDLVASIAGNEVQEIMGSSILAVIDENEQKTFYLPSDAQYSIKIAATDDGEMTYSVNEFDRNEMSAIRTVNYYDVELARGGAFSATIESLNSNQAAKYELKDAAGNVIAPSEDVSGSKVSDCMVTVSAKGNGTATGEGARVKGEFALLTAYPTEGSGFIGWYIGSEKISDEMQYRFCVLDDVDIVAKFDGAAGNGLALQWWMWLGGALMVILVVAVIVMAIVNKRKKHRSFEQ